MNYSGLKMSQHPPKGEENEKKLFRLFLSYHTTNQHDQIHNNQHNTQYTTTNNNPHFQVQLRLHEVVSNCVTDPEVDATDAAALKITSSGIP